MKFILKILLAPLMLVFWIVECNVQNGCICLGIAFLLSPYGLHLLAVKLVAWFIVMRTLLKEKIYG